MNRERYDPSKPVCDNQDDFNIAVKKALKQKSEDDYNDSKTGIAVLSLLYFIFVIWALVLAMKLPSGSERTEHLIFAMFTGPVYVVAHYLNGMK